MTVFAVDSLEVIAQSESEESKKKLRGKQDEGKEYHTFFETIKSLDLDKEGTKTHLAKKIRKLNFEEIAADAELIAKLTLLLAGTHAPLMQKQVLQRGLINKLQKAFEHRNVVAQLVCLKLINIIDEDSLKKKLEKTKDIQTVKLIKAFKGLSNQGVQFSINPDLTIFVKPKEFNVAQLSNIQKFLSAFSWDNIHLNVISENEATEIEYHAKVYDAKSATLRDATTKDLDTFDAIYQFDRNAVESDFTSDIMEQPKGIVLTVETKGIPTKNFRILIDENGIMIIGHWTTYIKKSNGYKTCHEWYYEDMDFIGIALKPETFTFDELDENTFVISINTKE